MTKKLGIALLGLFSCFALAQPAVIGPTTGNGADAFHAGTESASVEQNVNLILPPTVALHLDVTELDFDMGLLGSGEEPYVCVYGLDFRGTDTRASDFNGQAQWLPLGTYYTRADSWSATQDPSVRIVDYQQRAESYPPILFDDDGELIDGSKNYFVCYQTFILQKFSNYSSWNLHVQRSGDATFDMYVQDNTFCSFNAGTPTGFFRIAGGQTIDLLPETLTNNTTGNLAAACGQTGKSWLDDLVVVAVKVNGDEHGTNTAVLTYTISAEVPN